MAAMLRASTRQFKKREMHDIVSSAIPAKSEKRYLQTYKEFTEFHDEDKREEKPEEVELLQWFDYLLNIKNLKATSCWTR